MLSVVGCDPRSEQFRRITTARRNNDGPMTLNENDDDGEGRRRVNIGKPYIELKLLIRGRQR